MGESPAQDTVDPWSGLTQYLLDSNAVIGWLNGQPATVALFDDLIRGGDSFAVNAICVAETYAGVKPKDEPLADRLFAGLSYWPIDREIARRAGTYRYFYARQGTQLSLPDTLIAAHAISRDATLITGNVKDFPMPELKLMRLPAG